MAFRSEPVECSAHVNLLLRTHVEEGQIYCRAACVTALGADVFLVEKHALVQVGIEVGSHKSVGDVLGPAHKMVNTPLWAVGIVYLQAVAQLLDIVAHGPQTVCCNASHQRSRFFVTVDAGSHEIVCTEVTDFEDYVWCDIG